MNVVPTEWRTAPDLLTSRCRADHSRSNITGYVVVVTIGPDGKIIRDRLGNIGIDYSFHSADRYSDALCDKDAVRAALGGRAWTVIQDCFACGCRLR